MQEKSVLKERRRMCVRVWKSNCICSHLSVSNLLQLRQTQTETSWLNHFFTKKKLGKIFFNCTLIDYYRPLSYEIPTAYANPLSRLIYSTNSKESNFFSKEQLNICFTIFWSFQFVPGKGLPVLAGILPCKMNTSGLRKTLHQPDLPQNAWALRRLPELIQPANNRRKHN